MRERTDILPSELAALLLEAKDLHTKFEVRFGPDKHWEKWYGIFLAHRLTGIDKETAAGWANIDVMDASLTPLTGIMGRKDPI